MQHFIVLVILVVIVSGGVKAYQSSQKESTEQRTLSNLPPSVQYVVAQMDGGTQAAFFNEYWDKRRKISVGYVCWIIFGFHYFYIKKFGLQVLFWLSFVFFGLGLIWWIIDFFRIPSIMREANEQIARQALQTLQIATSYSAPSSVIDQRPAPAPAPAPAPSHRPPPPPGSPTQEITVRLACGHSVTMRGNPFGVIGEQAHCSTCGWQEVVAVLNYD